MPDSRRLAPDPLPWRRRPPKGPRRDDPPWPEPPPPREVPQTVPQPECEPVPAGRDLDVKSVRLVRRPRDWNDPDFVSHVLNIGGVIIGVFTAVCLVLTVVFQVLIKFGWVR